VQSPSEEQRCSLGLPVRELPLVVALRGGHDRKCRRGADSLRPSTSAVEQMADPSGRLDKPGGLSHQVQKQNRREPDGPRR
jgi:hypothetical protein